MKVLLITAALVAGTAVGTPPTAGASGLGDRLFPGLGNGGYDARSYDVSYDYRPGVSTMASSVVMQAKATEALSSFSLDSLVSRIGSVSVDDRPASFRTEGEKLFVTPTSAIQDGGSFTVRVSYTSDRNLDPPSPALHLPPGADTSFLKAWINTPDGFAFMGQPDRAHLFFPANDHPRDKARFTFRVTTPADLTAVSNGTLVSRVSSGGRTTYVWRTASAIPTDITQVAVGKFREIDQTGPHGLPVQSFLPAALSGDDLVRQTPAQISWLEQTLGLPFPFERYGVLGLDSMYDGVALETATMSTFPAIGFTQPAEEVTPVMVHELTHQYFGDAVSVGSWDDMWLSEGHATYYQMAFSAQLRHITFADNMKSLYAVDADQRATWGPPAHLHNAGATLVGSDAVGALSLFALHELVGPDTFSRIERAFYTQFHGHSARTSDYISVANRVSGRDLTSFLTSWLYGATTPPMPGHPDWKPGQP
jgi:aminopeptidase N